MRRSRIFLTILLVVLGIVALVLPSTLRLQAVVSLGVVAADNLAVLGTVAGVACLLGAGAIGALEARREILRRQATAQAELAAGQWEKLPAKDEVRREVIEPMLRLVADRYPQVAEPIQESLRQLGAIHHVLDAVGDIFEVSPGMVTMETARYGSVEYLISDMLRRVYPGLVRIIYQAHVNATGNVEKLREVVEAVNAENAATVDLVEEIGSGVAYSSTRHEGRQLAREKFEEAIRQLYSTEEEKGPLSL